MYDNSLHMRKHLFLPRPVIFPLQHTVEKFLNILQIPAQQIITKRPFIRIFTKQVCIVLFAEGAQVRLLRRQHYVFQVDQPEFSLRVPDQIPAVNVRMAQDKGQAFLFQFPRFFAQRFILPRSISLSPSASFRNASDSPPVSDSRSRFSASQKGSS